ncbi:Na+-transporting NADH:ubiquinone oxidoreductase subunit B [Nonlabens dokdonensis]|jgi:Na+-transporting NADH:ubiquinone oxidoreductase subunit B|uniref:Na(+)-translocating NADH-quinone reductase subunit B n=2 Tax=Nonlabens dokdonensis TaxID=328515 RepID=L7W5P9_NONDD|nr:NADH:ubiquinone reductase (Na(+)-transporting) subunit B [Nonlabens dokdonensis]AGC76995.1 Na-translocating NADH-quinone reductase subunit B [Nonlabens dokdonensis DSW-6]PZX36896.1 Na+-transporting NADH:ubiquinone oxidoreductase subunit B [Nonlabens dokdonensis]
MKWVRNKLDQARKPFEPGQKFEKFAPAINAFDTFLFTPNHTTKKGAHIRDVVDLKRTMITVVLALIPALLFGMWNTGAQYLYQDMGLANVTDVPFWDAFIEGAILVTPLIIVSYVVGLTIEFIFAIYRGHEVNEGYLVTGLLIPMIFPVDIPLWMLAISVAFAVLIGKEAFGGTGMNILNPALTARAFAFFAYPLYMSGNAIWVHQGSTDTVSGETILGALASGSYDGQVTGYAQNAVAFSGTTGAGQPSALAEASVFDAFMGFIPGSVAETSALMILLGALILIATKVGSWRIIVGGIVGGMIMGGIFNLFGTMGSNYINELVSSGTITMDQIQNDASAVAALGLQGWDATLLELGTNQLINFPFWQHLVVGSILFGIVFMATDPVSAAQTMKGKWIYGILAGFFGIMIRVFNPAYPEGIMLAILLMNVFAPTIDHYVIQANVNKRKKRLSKAKAQLQTA